MDLVHDQRQYGAERIVLDGPNPNEALDLGQGAGITTGNKLYVPVDPARCWWRWWWTRHLPNSAVTDVEKAVRTRDCFSTVCAHQNRSSTIGRLFDQLTQGPVSSGIEAAVRLVQYQQSDWPQEGLGYHELLPIPFRQHARWNVWTGLKVQTLE